MSERIYGVALLPDGKRHECWVSVGAVVTQPLSQRIKPGDVLENQAGGRIRMVRRESDSVWLFAWADEPSIVIHLAAPSLPYWLLVEPAPAAEPAPLPLSARIKPGDTIEASGHYKMEVVCRASGSQGWLVCAAHNHALGGYLSDERCNGEGWRVVDPAPAATETVVSRPAPPGEWQDDALGVKKAARAWLDRRHNAHCPRCYGPAYQGLGALRCERVGGCLVEREPGPTEVGQDKPFVSIATDRGERAWWVYGHSVIRRAQYATRELAVAAWREAVIAKAKREAGL